MVTRAKFYVSNVNSTNNDNKFWHTVCLNACYSTDKNSENYVYWTASPSGTFKLSINEQILNDLGIKLGTYWYIDVEKLDQPTEDQDNIWRLSKLEKSYTDSLTIKLVYTQADWTKGCTFGEFEITINNKNAWELYQKLDDLYILKLIPATKD